MARRMMGEARVRIGARNVRLRLDIGTMMDLEDYFGMGLVPFLTSRLTEFRLSDMAALFLAMTGGDFGDADARRKAGEKLLKAGLAESATAISQCLENTLSAPEPGKPHPLKATKVPG
ncbi:gene transfer agent family protein [Kordiimonas aestuarii]|uniref:gene transfer agent family protein n=1 Tax=Kordiimonas aestuarii TaxID=1005925 RepID=UPI0021D2677A|nr:gene transfer agent family protein [Kordiimonas aestuarii]